MAANDSNKPKKIKEAEAKLAPETSSAPVLGTDQRIEKKYWKITDVKNHYKLQFFPVYLVNDETKEIECRNLEIVFEDEKGKKHEMVFDWLNIYMFIYYTANEELRQQLATRYERKVNYIPYDVTVRVSPEEARAGTAKRRVELPVDELTMAIAREEAWKLWMKNKDHWSDPKHFRYKSK